MLKIMKECIILTVIFKDIFWLNVDPEKNKSAISSPNSGSCRLKPGSRKHRMVYLACWLLVAVAGVLSTHTPVQASKWFIGETFSKMVWGQYLSYIFTNFPAFFLAVLLELQTTVYSFRFFYLPNLEQWWNSCNSLEGFFLWIFLELRE